MIDEYEDLNPTRHGAVMVIELNRTSKRNAMRLQMRTELIDMLTRAESDDTIEAIVITGAGEHAFSAGADLTELRDRTVASEMSRHAELRRRLPEMAESLSKPIVAAINGACIGAGLEFALACPVRIATESATFGMPEVQLGVIPGSGGTQRLTRVVGLGWSTHMTLIGQPISADIALRIGLVTGVYTRESLLDEAISLAGTMASHPPLAYQSARDAVTHAFDLDLGSGIDLERKLFALCLSTGIPRERADAVLAKVSSRAPNDESSHV